MGQEILTVDQKAVLDLVGKNSYISENFYLTGGTALAEYYLKHRYSDDLDFFTERGDVDNLVLNIFVNEVKTKLKFASVEYRKIHDRRIFFFKKNSNELKVEFTAYPYPKLQTRKKAGQVNIDSLYDISVNKLTALIDRIEVKDFTDLYFVLNEENLKLENLLLGVKEKFGLKYDPLTLGGEFAKVRTFNDLPRMIKPLTLDVLKDFYSDLAKSLREKILRS